MRKLTIELIRKSFKNEDYMLCSTEYLGAHFYLDVICPNGHKWRITWQKWLIGRRCKYCNRSIYFNTVRKDVKQEGYILVSKEYENNKSKLELICPFEHRCSISYAHWKSGTRCKKCFFDSLKTPFGFVKKSIEKEGCVLKTDGNEYENCQSKFKIICKCGHVFVTTWNK